MRTLERVVLVFAMASAVVLILAHAAQASVLVLPPRVLLAAAGWTALTLFWWLWK